MEDVEAQAREAEVGEVRALGGGGGGSGGGTGGSIDSGSHHGKAHRLLQTTLEGPLGQRLREPEARAPRQPPRLRKVEEAPLGRRRRRRLAAATATATD